MKSRANSELFVFVAMFPSRNMKKLGSIALVVWVDRMSDYPTPILKVACKKKEKRICSPIIHLHSGIRHLIAIEYSQSEISSFFNTMVILTWSF